jgi:hypothetical protein
MLCHYAKCCYAECHYAERCSAKLSPFGIIDNFFCKSETIPLICLKTKKTRCLKRKNAKTQKRKKSQKTQEQRTQRKLGVSLSNFWMFFDETPGTNLIENAQLWPNKTGNIYNIHI